MPNDILVLADHLKGQLSDATFELLGKAKDLAGATGGQAVVALLGAPELVGSAVAGPSSLRGSRARDLIRT